LDLIHEMSGRLDKMGRVDSQTPLDRLVSQVKLDRLDRWDHQGLLNGV
jgi:hypothetical protein